MLGINGHLRYQPQAPSASLEFHSVRLLVAFGLIDKGNLHFQLEAHHMLKRMLKDVGV